MRNIAWELTKLKNQKEAADFSNRLNLTRIKESKEKVEQIQKKKQKSELQEELEKAGVNWDTKNINTDPQFFKNRLLNTQIQQLELDEKRAQAALSTDINQGIKFSSAFTKEEIEIENSAYNDENIKNSSIIFLDSKDLSDYWNKFEASNGITQLTYTLLLSNSLILTCVFGTIIFLYGNYLLERFQIEEKYPKLAILIKYRRKVSKYYIVSNFVVIILVCLINIFLGLSILSLDV